MIEQNGHAVTTVPAPVSCSCLNRTSLMRVPGSSSLSANSSPPPAPQQYGLSRLRSGSRDVAAESRQQRARLVDLPGIPSQIARVVIRHGLGRLAVAPHGRTRELFDEHRRVDDVDVVAEPPVVVADGLHAVRARRRRSSSEPAAFRSSMFAVASSWNMYSLPVRLAGSPVHRSFDSTPKRTALRTQDLEQRTQRLLEVGLERAGAAEPHEHVVLRADRTSRARPSPRTSGAGRSPGPRCSPRRSRLLYTPPRYSGRVAVRHQAAPRADDDRQVFDAHRDTGSRRHRRSCTATAPSRCRSRRACFSRSPASSASCVCRMIVFGLSSLPAPHAGQLTWQRPHSTHVNASSTLLLPRSLTVSRPTCFLLEVEIRHVAEFRRLQEHGDRREHQVKVLRRRNQREERQDHEHVHPPVDPPGQRRLVEPPRQEKRDHQRGDEQADDDRLDRHALGASPFGRVDGHRAVHRDADGDVSADVAARRERRWPAASTGGCTRS